MYTPPQAGVPDPTLQMRARLRPMGIGDILDATFSLYRANFSLFVATVAIVDVPLQIISIILQLSIIDTAEPLRGLSTTTGGLTTHQIDSLVHWLIAIGVVALITGILGLIAWVLQNAALAVVISNRYLDRSITVGDAYRAAVNRLGSLLLAGIWYVLRLILLIVAVAIIEAILTAITSAAHIAAIGILIDFLLSIAAFIFFVYFGVAWSLLSQVLMLEHATTFRATGRSRELIQGYWWKTFGLFVITFLLVLILGSIPAGVISSAMGGASLAARTLVSGIVGAIVTILLRPIQTGATTLLFYDLKIRKEAFDLEAMARHLGVAAPEAPEAPATWQ